DEMPYPSASNQLDYELELAAVIGREGSDLTEADGLSHIAGFTILCDWSARDLQRDEMQVGLGPAKGKDFCTSLGPLVVTTDELAPLIKDGRLAVSCTLRVNGDQWMDGDGGAMYHTWGQLVERASHDSRVVPGDVLGSGTIGGGSIGEAMHGNYPRARWLEPGARDLTIVCNSATGGSTALGHPDLVSQGTLLGEGRVRKVIASFTAATHPSQTTSLQQLVATGAVEAELVPQGTLAERIRAGGAGIPAFYTPTSVGTELAETKDHRVFNGRTYGLGAAITADYAFLRAWKADTFGNLVFRRSQRNYNPIMATAAR